MQQTEPERWKQFPCKVWTGSTDKNGYGRIHRKDRPNYVHIDTYVAKHGPVAKGVKVLHYCDNPPCYEIEHLWSGTQSDNIRDRIAKGRSSRQGNPKTTAEQRAEIIRRRRAGESPSLLAREFHLDRTRIWQIVRAS